MAKCNCGKRMSRYASHCRACEAARAAAFQERLMRLNVALQAADEAGRPLVMNTAFGPHVVVSMNHDCWASCYPEGARRSEFTRRSFSLHGGHVEDFENELQRRERAAS